MQGSYVKLALGPLLLAYKFARVLAIVSWAKVKYSMFVAIHDL